MGFARLQLTAKRAAGCRRTTGVTFHLSAVTQPIHLRQIGLTTGVTPHPRPCFPVGAVTQLARFKTRPSAPTAEKPRFSAIARVWHGDCSLKPVQAGRGKSQLRRRAEHRDMDCLGDRMAMPMGGPGLRRHEARSWPPERSLPPHTGRERLKSIPPQGGDEGGNPATPVAGAPMEAPDPTPAGRGPSFPHPPTDKPSPRSAGLGRGERRVLAVRWLGRRPTSHAGASIRRPPRRGGQRYLRKVSPAGLWTSVQRSSSSASWCFLHRR